MILEGRALDQPLTVQGLSHDALNALRKGDASVTVNHEDPDSLAWVFQAALEDESRAPNQADRALFVAAINRLSYIVVGLANRVAELEERAGI